MWEVTRSTIACDRVSASVSGASSRSYLCVDLRVSRKGEGAHRVGEDDARDDRVHDAVCKILIGLAAFQHGPSNRAEVPDLAVQPSALH
jgi:hypothetical protein